MTKPQDVLDFWFSDQMSGNWFAKSDDIDREIKQRFGHAQTDAHAGLMDDWIQAPDSALALIILLDQFPRNIHRGSPRSFASDTMALYNARAAIKAGHDRDFTPEQRQFFYLPLMHSENLADQERSVALYEKLGNAHSLHFAREHRDIIAQFGRFPHRNAVLGRDNTPQETDFLKTHSGF